MKYLYKYFLYFLFLIVFVLLAFIAIYGFEGVVNCILELLGRGDKMDLVRPIIQSFPFVSVILFLLLLLFFISLLLYKQDRVLFYLNVFFKWWKDAFVNLFLDIKSLDVLIVMLVPFAASIYFANNIAVSYDEAITYNLFTSKPFFYSMIFYPYPNNHVLHSLITNFTEYIPFVSILLGIRLPAIIASLFTWLIAYSFVKKFYSQRAALLIVGLASAMYMTIYYSFMSRGYALMVLAFVVCVYAAFNIIKKGSQNKDWMFFIVGGIIGCYTIPSFLYPFATINILILLYNYRNIKQQIIANIIAGMSVILLYSPIMLVDGISALTSNQFVQQIKRVDILNGIVDFYKGMVAEIIGMPYQASFIIFALLLIVLLLVVYRKDKWHLSLWLVFILAPFVLLMLHAVHPFYRTFLYYNFVLVFLIVIPFKSYLDKIPKYLLLLFIIIVQLVGVYNFNRQVKEKEGFNTFAKVIVDTYFKKENSIFFPCISSANFEFEAKVMGLEDKIQFREDISVDVDTLDRKGYIIVVDYRDKTVYKKPYQVIGEQHIYKNE